MIAAWIRRLIPPKRRPRGARAIALRRDHRSPFFEPLERRCLLTVTASINSTGALQVQITGTDTALITEDASKNVVVEDATNTIVFTGGQASALTGISVASGGTSDVTNLTQVGSSPDFTRLATVTVNAGTGAQVLLSGSITTSGDQTYAAAAQLQGNTTLTSTSGTVLFAKTLDGPFQLATKGGGTVFEGAVGSAASLATVIVGTSAAADLNGGFIHTTGVQLYQPAVLLTADTTLVSDTSAIQFFSTVDGSASLATTSAVNTEFGGAVGSAKPLTSLSTSGAGTTFLYANVTTSGAQAYQQAVQLAGNVAIATSGGNVTFFSTVDDAGDLGAPVGLTIDTTGGSATGPFGQTQFDANVGANLPLATLTVTTGGPMSIDHQVVVLNNILLAVVASPPGAAGDDLTVASGGALRASAGTIELRAGENLTLAAGSNLTATGVTLRGDFGAKNNPSGPTTALLAGSVNSPMVAVVLGSGNDTVDIAQTAANTSTTVTGGSGNDTFNLSSAVPGTGGTLSALAGPITINGGSGLNTLNLDALADKTPGLSGTLTSTNITGLGMAVGVTYANLQQISLQLARGSASVLTILSTAAGTAVAVTGGDLVNIGGGAGGLDPILSTLAVNGAGALNIDDRQATTGHTYDVAGNFLVRAGASAQAAVTQAAAPTQVGVAFSQVGAVTINAGPQNDTFNLFLPLAARQVLQIDGGGGTHNDLHVVGSGAGPNTAIVGNFGSGDPIQVRNIQCIDMYGAPNQPNFFVNQTSVPSILIGGMKNDTLVGGSGPDVLFGGAGNDLLLAGGTAGSPGTDFTFADLLPAFLPNGTLNTNVADTAAYPPQSGTKTIDGGGGVVVFFNAGTGVADASSVTYMQCNLPGSRALLQTLFNQALVANPCLAMLASPPTPPPTATTQAAVLNDSPYINQAFLDILGRPADAGSLNFWAGQLAGGLSRAAFASALAHSDEYDRLFVTSAYAKYLGRQPDAAGLGFWLGQMQSGVSDQRLEAALIGSPEYYARAGGSDTLWIDAVYRDLLGRPADSPDATYWTGQLQSGVSRTTVAYLIASGAEGEQQVIVADYLRYLRRSPGPAEINYWQAQFAAGVTAEDLIATFVASDEYFAGVP